jgi:hypothetical protein
MTVHIGSELLIRSSCRRRRREAATAESAVGAHDDVSVLPARDPAAQVSLDNLSAVAALLDRVWRAGAREKAAALAERLPVAGDFDRFLDIDHHRKRSSIAGLERQRARFAATARSR